MTGNESKLNCFEVVLYKTIYETVCKLFPSSKSHLKIKQEIYDKYPDLIIQLYNKNNEELLESKNYFEDRATKEFNNSGAITNSWELYWTERKYNEYLFIADFIENIISDKEKDRQIVL